MRNLILRHIKWGGLERFVNINLETMTSISHRQTERIYPINSDLNSENSLKRENIFALSRQYILRICEVREGVDETNRANKYGVFELLDTEATITWDLSYDIYHELLPYDIATTLRMVLLAKKEE